jgi:hypothetical protein
MAKKPTPKPRRMGVEKQIEDLATMVARGFGEVSREVNDVRQSMSKEFGEVHKRLDKIENVLIASHQNQIDQLRDTLLRIMAHINMPKENRVK